MLSLSLLRKEILFYNEGKSIFPNRHKKLYKLIEKRYRNRKYNLEWSLMDKNINVVLTILNCTARAIDEVNIEISITGKLSYYRQVSKVFYRDYLELFIQVEILKYFGRLMRVNVRYFS